MNRHHVARALIVLTLMATLSCAAKSNDPLKNTRQLVKEGHADLYHNGAFNVPNTSIYLIEPGPTAWEFVKELAGLRAVQSLRVSLKKASESVYIVSKGTDLTFRIAKAEKKAGSDAADYIRNHTRPGATLIMDRSIGQGMDIVGDSYTFSKELFGKMSAVDKGITGTTDSVAKSMDSKGTEGGKSLIDHSLSSSKDFFAERQSGASASLAHAKNRFIKGYVALPRNIGNNLESAGDNLSGANIVDIVEKNNVKREEWSAKSVQIMGSAVDSYTDDVKKSFAKAGREWDNCYTTGIPLATLKSLRWVLQGILWDAAIEPVSKMTVGGLGYVAVNSMAFPVMVLQDEGKALTRIAVDVAWNSSKSLYQLTAPSAEASLAAVYGLLESGSGFLGAGAMAAGGTIGGATEIGASKAGALVVKGSGQFAGKTARYIGVPLAAAGVSAAGGTVGVAVMGGGVVGSGSVFLSGETASATSEVFGNVIAGTTAVGGTAASAVGGTAYGVYQLSKAVAVPTGYEVGAGVVLSYETLAHISAHSILAASDCAYMVLSLEGPRWVAYSVKDTLGMGEDLVPGTVLNLDEMRKAGEEIYNIPLSDEEMKKVVSETSRSLPHIKDEPAPSN